MKKLYMILPFWKVKDGKMVEAWILEDQLTMSQQLGMELKPKED